MVVKGLDLRPAALSFSSKYALLSVYSDTLLAPLYEVLDGGLDLLHILLREAQEGPGGDFDLDLFLRDPAPAHLEAEPLPRLRPD